MKAKKLLAVAVTLCLLLCAVLPMGVGATEIPTLTADPDSGEYTMDMAAGAAKIVIEGYGFATINAANGPSYTVTTTSDAAASYMVVTANQYGYQFESANGTVADAQLMWDGFIISNMGDATITVTITPAASSYVAPDGTYDHPYEYSGFWGVQVLYGEEVAATYGAESFETDIVYYSWEAQGDGVVYMGNIAASDLEYNPVGWTYTIINKTSGASSTTQYSTDTIHEDTTVEFTDGDVILFAVGTYAQGSNTCPDGILNFQIGYDVYGSQSLPYTIKPGETTYEGIGDKYFYTEESNVPGKLIITTDAEVWDFGYTSQYQKDDDGNVVIDVPAGEDGVVGLNIYNSGAGEVEANIIYALQGSEYWPIEITELGEVTASDLKWPGVHYYWESDVDGLLVFEFESENWQLTVGEATYPENEGDTYAIVEVADGEVVEFVVYDPTAFGAEYDVTFTMSAEAFSTEETPVELKEGDNYVAIPSKKGEEAGKAYATINLDKEVILTIENYWSGITVDGTAVTANRLGVVKVLLAAGEHEIVLDNTLEEYVELTVNVAEPALGSYENPIEVSAVGKLSNTSVEAGSEVNYAVNSKLDGAILTVKGDVVVMVNGTEVKAEDGVVTVELKATGATMAVTIVNAGTATATYEASIAIVTDNPATGDMGIILPVMAMLMSACGAVVVGKKKD